MEPLTLKEIIDVTGGRLVNSELGIRNAEIKIQNISTDSRTVKPGDLFIAIRGKNLDGHNYLKDAFQKGALATIVSKPIDAPRPQILVDDTIKALGRIAKYYRQMFNCPTIAITGSNGKTTTKEMVAQILGSRFKVVKAPASYNNDIGVPLTILQIDRTTEVVVLETEMNRLGGTKELAEIAQPEIGIITNIGDTHLEYLGTRANVAKEKQELLEFIEEEFLAKGVAIFNFADPLVKEIVSRLSLRKIAFGIDRQADIFTEKEKIVDLGLAGTYFLLQSKYRVRLKVPGIQNIENALAAIGVAQHLGIDYSTIISVLEDYKNLPLRFETFTLRNKITVINDSYNANPQSMAAAFNAVDKTPGRKIGVLGDMLELGERSEFFHSELGRKAAKVFDILIAVGRFAGAVVSGAKTAGIETTMVCENNDEALNKLIDILKPKDIILIKGSRAMKMEEIALGLKSYYETHLK